MGDPLDNVQVPSTGPTQAHFPTELEDELDAAFTEAMIETDVREKILGIVKTVMAKYLL
jgi:hypothetical protein